MYKYILKPIFFLFSPEGIHHFVFSTLKFLCAVPGLSSLMRGLYLVEDSSLQVKLLGLTFPNPVGLAAGFDKDAKLFDELACLGFGFIEVGTVTPLAQSGNPKPRMFRLTEDEGLINRMGFNNEGVEAMVTRLRKRKNKTIVIGGNIGKNKITGNTDAVSDYEKCFDTLFPWVDYFVVNVSSPNTPNLRELQDKEPLKKLLEHIMKLNAATGKPKPVLLKIAPDLNESQLEDIASITRETGISGIVATNTTISRTGLKTTEQKVSVMGAGGLSGKPLTKVSLSVVSSLRSKLGPAVPIIGVGGIHSPEDALNMLKAGANLVQLYTGFIYEGPALPRRINKCLLKNISQWKTK
jgi:dihydroorotate dehydrogenase